MHSNLKSASVRDILGRETIHPFPARMAPSIALAALNSLKQPIRVLDPMMGSGTVLAVARASGHVSYGVDMDPLAVLLAKVWTTPIDHNDALEAARLILAKAKQRFEKTSSGIAYPENCDAETRAFVRYWFDDYARRQLAALAVEISKVTSLPLRNVLWCAFSRLIITKQSGASLAMDVSHSRPHLVYERAPTKPFNKFSDAAERVIKNCIDNRLRRKGPTSNISEGDARNLKQRSNSIDLVLTSPPYLNAIDYMRCSKFSLIWMGYNLVELRSIRTRSVGTEKGMGESNSLSLAEDVLRGVNFTPALTKRSYSMLLRYVHDMWASMQEVSRVLKPNGQAIYVVGENTIRGTFIRNASIISNIADRIGLIEVSRENRNLPANRRYMPPPNRSRLANEMDLRMRREVVLTFKKPR